MVTGTLLRTENHQRLLVTTGATRPGWFCLGVSEEHRPPDTSSPASTKITCSCCFKSPTDPSKNSEINKFLLF